MTFLIFAALVVVALAAIAFVAGSSLNQRLDALSKRLDDGLDKHTEKTGETLKGLHERLAVIDSAQKNITDLSQQMVALQDILSNK